MSFLLRVEDEHTLSSPGCSMASADSKEGSPLMEFRAYVEKAKANRLLPE